jgi:hypothetical protein
VNHLLRRAVLAAAFGVLSLAVPRTIASASKGAMWQGGCSALLHNYYTGSNSQFASTDGTCLGSADANGGSGGYTVGSGYVSDSDYGSLSSYSSHGQFTGTYWIVASLSY